MGATNSVIHYTAGATMATTATADVATTMKPMTKMIVIDSSSSTYSVATSSSTSSSPAHTPLYQKNHNNQNNLKDDAQSFKSKVEAMKHVIKTDKFREKFLDCMDNKGKLPYIQCFQRLELARRLIIQEVSKPTNKSSTMIEEHSIEKLATELLIIIERYERITTNPVDGRFYPVFQESFEIFGDLLNTTNISSHLSFMNRIRAAQDHLLACLFNEFEEFVEGEDFQSPTGFSARVMRTPSMLIPIPRTLHTVDDESDDSISQTSSISGFY